MTWPDSAIDYRLGQLTEVMTDWRASTVEQRVTVLLKLAQLLEERKSTLALLITREMGKPIVQSEAEIEKCAWLCRYYAEQLPAFAAPRVIQTDAAYSAVHYAPLGMWLAIMPWNFPFWQVFRCAVPALAAGNLVVLKHASNVAGCGHAIEALIQEAAGGKPLLTFMVLLSSQVEKLITHPYIKGVSLTGSESAGKQVAALCGKHIKPVVLELGGSNALIVTEKADLALAAGDAVMGRFQNNGQSCIAAKRLIVHSEVYDAFMEQFRAAVRGMVQGDPEQRSTFVGPLAKAEFAQQVKQQVTRSQAMGAVVDTYGEHHGAHVAPMILENITPAMPAFREEIFGPAIAVFRASHWEEAIGLSNGTRFGLGVSIYHEAPAELLPQVGRFFEGAVFFNHIVKSDPRLPFGGVKASGFGRELSEEGIREFQNAQTVFVR